MNMLRYRLGFFTLVVGVALLGALVLTAQAAAPDELVMRCPADVPSIGAGEAPSPLAEENPATAQPVYQPMSQTR